MQRALEALFGELTLGPALSPEALLAACDRHGISQADRRALVASHERLLVYRELVRGNLREAIGLSIPRSIARLGELFDEYFDRFLVEQGPRTHYLRDVTPELLAFCRPLWENDVRVPGYLPDLALHESLHIEVSALPALPQGHDPGPLTLEHAVEFTEALRLVEYGHAVHELDQSLVDHSTPTPRPVALLVYRSPEHDVRYLELSPLAHGIVLRLIVGDALGSAVTSAAASNGTALTEAVLSGAARLLADLAERGVIRGAKPPPTPANGPAA